jgi:hypothetical protein
MKPQPQPQPQPQTGSKLRDEICESPNYLNSMRFLPRNQKTRNNISLFLTSYFLLWECFFSECETLLLLVVDRKSQTQYSCLFGTILTLTRSKSSEFSQATRFTKRQSLSSQVQNPVSSLRQLGSLRDNPNHISSQFGHSQGLDSRGMIWL